MAEAKFYRCSHCGNIVYMVEDAGVPVVCCGEKMQLLEAGTSDGAVEKHVPSVTVDGSHMTVNVGEVDHPMTEEHYIEWVALVGPKTVQIKKLNPGDAPQVRFGVCPHCTCTDRTVYSYCNLHGLFATTV